MGKGCGLLARPCWLIDVRGEEEEEVKMSLDIVVRVYR